MEGGGGNVHDPSLNVCSHWSLLNLVSLLALCGSGKALPCGTANGGGGGGIEAVVGDCAALEV